MKVEEVPQEKGMIEEGYGSEICYAVQGDGSYTLSSSAGWDPKNIVNDQAWQLIAAETMRAYGDVKAGKKSPIAFYQARHQMDLALLATYIGLPRWRVWRHLKPAVFAKLPIEMLQRYADLFGITISELQHLPENFTPEKIQYR